MEIPDASGTKEPKPSKTADANVDDDEDSNNPFCVSPSSSLSSLSSRSVRGQFTRSRHISTPKVYEPKLDNGEYSCSPSKSSCQSLSSLSEDPAKWRKALEETAKAINPENQSRRCKDDPSPSDQSTNNKREWNNFISSRQCTLICICKHFLRVPWKRISESAQICTRKRYCCEMCLRYLWAIRRCLHVHCRRTFKPISRCYDFFWYRFCQFFLVVLVACVDMFRNFCEYLKRNDVYNKPETYFNNCWILGGVSSRVQYFCRGECVGSSCELFETAFFFTASRLWCQKLFREMCFLVNAESVGPRICWGILL